jgi:hypothetical protein
MFLKTELTFVRSTGLDQVSSLLSLLAAIAAFFLASRASACFALLIALLIAEGSG